MIMENEPWMKMDLPLNMVIFQLAMLGFGGVRGEKLSKAQIRILQWPNGIMERKFWTLLKVSFGTEMVPHGHIVLSKKMLNSMWHILHNIAKNLILQLIVLQNPICIYIYRHTSSGPVSEILGATQKWCSICENMTFSSAWTEIVLKLKEPNSQKNMFSTR